MFRRLIGLSVVMLFVGCGDDNYTPTSPPANVSVGGPNTPTPAAHNHPVSPTTATSGSWASITSGQSGPGPYTVTNPGGYPSTTSCGVTVDGDGYCWGDHRRGQLGAMLVGSHSHFPVLVNGGYTWASIEAGSTSCGVTVDGGGYCWGANDSGQLGRGTWGRNIQSPVPGLVSGGHTWSSISTSSGSHGPFSDDYSKNIPQVTSCGVTVDGDGYCWGRGSEGQIGDSVPYQEFYVVTDPVLVSGGHTWSSIDAGLVTCGVTVDGDGYCWGWGGAGMLGNGISEGIVAFHYPVLVSGGHNWSSISTQGMASCGVTVDGDGYCWGRNEMAQLGVKCGIICDVPALVSGGHTWTSISRGISTTCGVTTDGDGYCWGEDVSISDYFQPLSHTPALVSGGHTWVSITPGRSGICGVTTDGGGYCWGDNQQGSLGNNSTSERIGHPVRVITPWVE